MRLQYAAPLVGSLSSPSAGSVCQFNFENLISDLTPEFPLSHECESGIKYRSTDWKCSKTKFLPTTRFCYQHIREYHFSFVLEDKVTHTIGTPLNSVTNIRPAFESGDPIQDHAEALYRLLDAMEHVPAKLDRQSELAPCARFKSSDKRQSKITEFLSVTEKIVEQADKVASSVSSRHINRQMKRRGLTRDEDLDTDVETDDGLEIDDDGPDGNLWEGDDLIDNEQDEE